MSDVMDELRARIVLVSYDQPSRQGFGGLRRRVPSLAKAERAVGDRPQVGLDETRRRVIGFLRASGRQ